MGRLRFWQLGLWTARKMQVVVLFPGNLEPLGEAMYHLFHFYAKQDREFFICHTSKILTATSLHPTMVKYQPDVSAKIREAMSTFKVSLVRIWSQYPMEISSSVHDTQNYCSKLFGLHSALLGYLHNCKGYRLGLNEGLGFYSIILQEKEKTGQLHNHITQSPAYKFQPQNASFTF